ncbi:methyltransferase domain-containing protein [Desulfobacter latus]|uniref:Methyltransferase domain-containing protein n=1 Tax=Desulfobacter latus TaxID=2292 RepID=A0A850T1I9_9BACT|nr:methyltransferase domain-containing protein [Desulfobacter latus]NWH04961.1 methyltransferase domain-containing protein [Desulfobacter latus]
MVERYRFLFNPQMADIVTCSLGNIEGRGEEETLELIKRLMSLDAGKIESREVDVLSQAYEMFLRGERVILLWDEMAKLTEMSFLASCLPLKAPLVDFCCGYGYWISKTLKRIDIGIDIFEQGSREHGRPLSGFLDNDFANNTYRCVLQADCTSKLPIPDCSCGTVTCISGMEYISNYKSLLAQAWRILEAGGKFILTANTDKKIRFYKRLLPAQYVESEFERKQVENIIDIKSWRAVLKEAGFEIIKEMGYMDATHAFLHMLTTYPNCYKTFWSQDRLAELVRNDPEVLSLWRDKVLPWLIESCDVDQAGVIAFLCEKKEYRKQKCI